MTRREKIVARILARPPEALSSDVRALLEEFGYEQARQSGSHVVFRRRGEHRITVPLVQGRRVKRRYLEEIIRRLGLEENNDNSG